MPDQKQDDGLSHLSRILGFLFGSNALSRLAGGQPQQPPPVATPPFMPSAQQYLAEQIAANPNNHPNNIAIQQRLAPLQRPPIR